MILSRTLVALGLLALLSGCGGDDPADKQKSTRAQLVEAVPVSRQSLVHASHLSGTLQAYSTVRLFNQEEGAITTILVHEGDAVKDGDTLVRMDDRLLRADLNKATANRKQAEQDVARLTKLRQRKLVAEDEMLRAGTALDVAVAEEQSLATRLGYTRVQAPISGLISERQVEPGDVIPKYTHLLTIIDNSKLLTEVTVSELLMPELRIDEPVSVQIDALPGQTFMGRILRIHPALDATTRRGKIEVILDQPPAAAQPGQLCRVSLSGTAQQRLTVPFNALRRDEQGEHVFVIDADNRAQRRAVRTGLRIADSVEILDGLAIGEQVIVRGFLGLKAGKEVRLAGEKAGKKPAKPDAQ